VRRVLDELRERWRCRRYRLRVRLRVGELTGPGGKLQKAMWMTFFSHHEFATAATPGEGAAGEVVLQREFAG